MPNFPLDKEREAAWIFDTEATEMPAELRDDPRVRQTYYLAYSHGALDAVEQMQSIFDDTAFTWKNFKGKIRGLFRV